VSIKKGILAGAIAGVAVAILCISLDYIRPFTTGLNAFVERTTFKLCPLYALGFSDSVKTMGTLIALTILGNAVLYGVGFGAIAAIASLIRRLFS
jgi:hypothetical protein